MTIAVNRNLSNCKKAHKEGFQGFNRIQSRGLSVSANAEAMGSNPVGVPKSFFGLFCNCLNCDSLRWSDTHFIGIPAVHFISECNKPDNRHLASKFHNSTTTANLMLVEESRSVDEKCRTRFV